MEGYYIPSVTNPAIDFVLFDLGGVIIELGDVSSLQEMATSVGGDEQWHQWLASPWVRRFEKGECSAKEFSHRVVAEWGLDVTPERFLEIFRDWPIGPYSGTTDLLAEIRESMQIGCLSNTNSMHWDHQRSLWPVLDMFDFRFLSFELGLVQTRRRRLSRRRRPVALQSRPDPLLRRRWREHRCSEVVGLSRRASSRH